MNQAIEFLKTTALGGFLVLLPILLLYLMLSEAFELVVARATPLADLFPQTGSGMSPTLSRIMATAK